MNYAGLDIGGTKIEIRLFDHNWHEIGRHRVPTPEDYHALVDAVVDLVHGAEKQVGGPFTSVGIGSAGLINPLTGRALTANLSASGQPFPADIEAALGRPITYINDCRALAVSEAIFGAGRGHRTVMSLIIGTGLGGGLAVDGALLPGPTSTGGEFGHAAAPAHLIARHHLPIFECGCGRKGCYETYVSGPGLERLALHHTGKPLPGPEISARRDGPLREVWKIWCNIAAELILNLTLTVDPEIIVLGGGLSSIPHITDDLQNAARAAQIPGFSVPPIVLAVEGDASGAKGAAYAAMKAHQDG